MGEGHLRVHEFLPRSRANGPGARAVIWVQGCTLGCPGCFNPATHPAAGGERVAVDELFRRVAALEAEGAIEGLSISGGEPLQQRGPLLALLRRVRRETALSVVVFSGYAWEEIEALGAIPALEACVDVLVAGRYDRSRPIDAPTDLRSSSNQTLHLLSRRYTRRDLQAVPPAEIIVTPQGQVLTSGTQPVTW
jgi:anaerobic ribonucleoside-triphosphate reductase activating protein